MNLDRNGLNYPRYSFDLGGVLYFELKLLNRIFRRIVGLGLRLRCLLLGLLQLVEGFVFQGYRNEGCSRGLL